MIRSFTDLLLLWTPKQLSRVLGVRYQTVCGMYQRACISPRHWTRIIEVAAARGETITVDMLLRFRDEQKAAGKVERVVTRHRSAAPKGRPRAKSQTQSLPVP